MFLHPILKNFPCRKTMGGSVHLKSSCICVSQTSLSVNKLTIMTGICCSRQNECHAVGDLSPHQLLRTVTLGNGMGLEHTHTNKSISISASWSSVWRACPGYSPCSDALWLGLNDLCPVQQQPCPCRQRSFSVAGCSLSAVAETSHTGLRPYLACSVSYRPCQRGKSKPVSGKIRDKGTACISLPHRLRSICW